MNRFIHLLKEKCNNIKYWEWILITAGTASLFLFFQLLIPYHFFHKEQTLLFLLADDNITDYFTAYAALSNLVGDFLTQFFGYITLGPIIVTCLLLIVGVIIYRLFVTYIGRWAYIPSIAIILWEAGRECGILYNLSNTISLIALAGTILICIKIWKSDKKYSIPAIMVLAAVSIWLFGLGNWRTRLFDYPNMKLEKMLAIDSEYYFGRTKKLEALLSKNKEKSTFYTYYYNLKNCKEGILSEKIMNYYQPSSLGMFLPVSPKESYFTIYASSEAWFALGDMTMAEHATILGMIFSPRHNGSRAIKRLAEINLINGDDAAAMKYLRMLQKTICYRDWAESRIPGKQSKAVKKWLENKRCMLATSDTLRTSADIQRSLRNILSGNSKNYMALDYLLCYDLLNKDISAFAKDYNCFADNAPLKGIYAQAMLIYIAGKHLSFDEIKKYNISSNVIDDFYNYTKIYETNSGNGNLLKDKYEKSYWFYFHFATMKMNGTKKNSI